MDSGRTADPATRPGAACRGITLTLARTPHPPRPIAPVPSSRPDSPLSRRWRDDAALLRRYGCDREADVIERLADDLDHDDQAREAAPVDLATAARLSGYTRGHLRRMMRSGALPNLGTRKEPRFARSELPRKPGPTTRKEVGDPLVERLPSRTQIARAVVSGV